MSGAKGADIEMNAIPPSYINNEPAFPSRMFALTSEQSADMEALGKALQLVINGAEAAPAQVAALARGIAVMISLAGGSAPKGMPAADIWSGAHQSLPGGTHLLMLEDPQGGQNFTLRLDERDIPYGGEWEIGGAESAFAEFSLARSAEAWTLQVRDGSQEHAIALGSAPVLTWGAAPDQIRLFVPTGAAVTGIAEEIAPRVPDQPEEPSPEPTASASTPEPSAPAPSPESAAAPPPEPAAAPPASPPPAPARPSPAPTPIPKPEPISWHYLYQGQSQGPVAEDDLRGWLAEGRLPADTLVWNPTLSDWQPAMEVGLVPVPAKRFCGNCGAPLTPEARFCGGCGNALV